MATTKLLTTQEQESLSLAELAELEEFAELAYLMFKDEKHNTTPKN